MLQLHSTKINLEAFSNDSLVENTHTHFNENCHMSVKNEIKIDISFILGFFYQSSHGLMARTPDFHAENPGSNLAVGNKVFHFFSQFFKCKCFSFLNNKV